MEEEEEEEEDPSLNPTPKLPSALFLLRHWLLLPSAGEEGRDRGRKDAHIWCVRVYVWRKRRD